MSCSCYILPLSIFSQVGRSVLHSQIDMGQRIPLWSRCVVGLCTFKTSFAGGPDGCVVGGCRDQLGLHARMARHKRLLHTLTWAFRQIQMPRWRFWSILGCFTVGFDLKEWGNHRSGQWRWPFESFKHQVIGQ